MCLAGYLPPVSGKIDWSGLPDEARIAELMQSVGHLSGLKPALTLSENLAFWADLYGGHRDRIGAALEDAGLGGLGDLPASILSAGQTRRLALCRLLVAPRPVWLLDEPTSNLDADGDRWVAGLVETHLDTGGLAIIATHRNLALGRPAHELILDRAMA
jgi:heme exporter protein A